MKYKLIIWTVSGEVYTTEAADISSVDYVKSKVVPKVVHAGIWIEDRFITPNGIESIIVSEEK